jgi:hypothetical protein
MEVDEYNLTTDDFVCRSPKKAPAQELAQISPAKAEPQELAQISQIDHNFLVDQLCNAFEHAESREEFTAHLHEQTGINMDLLSKIVSIEGSKFLRDPFYEMDPAPYYKVV